MNDALDDSFHPSVRQRSAKRNARHSSEAIDREVVYGHESGYIYCARNYCRTINSFRSVTVYLSVDAAPFEISCDDETILGTGFIVKPLVARTINASRVDMVSAVVNPVHSAYRTFSMAPGNSLLSLDRAAFRDLEPKIAAASLGALNVDEAIRLHNALVEIAAASLPKPKPLDPRIADVIRRIHASPRAALGELAQASNLSYHRMSHLFTTNMGISVRSYQLWYKIDLAWRLILEGHKLADIAAMSGFCDAAHMCHIFQDAFGVPISYHLEKMKIRVRYAEAQPQIS